MTARLKVSSKKSTKKINNVALKWMNMKQNTTLDFKNLMETKLFNIQEKFNNQWESNLNQEKTNVRKFKKERNNNNKKLGNKLKRKKNNLEQRFWTSYNKISNKHLIKKDKKCRHKMMMSMMKTWNMIGSFVTIVERLSMNKRPIINVNNVRTICCVKIVMISSFISILYIQQLSQSDLALLKSQSVLRYCQNYNHVRHVEEEFHRQSNIFHMKTEQRMFNCCVIDAMMRVH